MSNARYAKNPEHVELHPILGGYLELLTKALHTLGPIKEEMAKTKSRHEDPYIILDYIKELEQLHNFIRRTYNEKLITRDVFRSLERLCENWLGLYAHVLEGYIRLSERCEAITLINHQLLQEANNSNPNMN